MNRIELTRAVGELTDDELRSLSWRINAILSDRRRAADMSFRANLKRLVPHETKGKVL